MTITSFWFFLMVSIGVLVYYIIPGRFQWVELLILSMVFYYFAATPYTIIYLILATLIAYLSTMFMRRKRQNEACDNKPLFAVTIVSIVIITAVWFLLKGRGLWLSAMSFMGINTDSLGGITTLIAALGMGYYTVQIIGYIIDCYWQSVEVQTNPVKLFLFVSYFPQLTTGPISRYENLKTLYDRHEFSYQNITFGAQRIIWGLFKKLVIAERAGLIFSTITSSPDTFRGFYSWIAVLVYPIQLYSDFSGCMDIVLGVSELFGIKLAENFNNPFFSRTSQELWQRWHITLGAWAKDYVLYPLLKTGGMVKFSKSIKNKLGKRASRFLTNAIGMFFLWMVMGIWHGGVRYIVGVSLWYWTILMLGDLFSPLFTKLTAALKIKTEAFSWRLFQSIRTYLIYSVGVVFFSVGISGGFRILFDALKVIFVKGYANPWIFFDGGLIDAGVVYRDINILIVGVVLLFIVAVLREKFGYARIWISEQGIVLRWLIWLSLFTAVLILGMYGPGYDASMFLYQGF